MSDMCSSYKERVFKVPVEDHAVIVPLHSTVNQNTIAPLRQERDVHTLHSQRNEIPACFRRFLREA